MENKSIEIVVVQNQADFDEVMKIRRVVFVDEQKIPAEQEFDGNDFVSTHILAKVDGVGVGTMRIRYFADFTKFERMAVLRGFRKTSVSSDIMNKGFEFVSRKGYRQVYGMCKKELLNRWRECGYERIEGAPVLRHNGMELIPIKRELPKDPKALHICSHPELLTAREDAWDEVFVPTSTSFDDDCQHQEQNFRKITVSYPAFWGHILLCRRLFFCRSAALRLKFFLDKGRLCFYTPPEPNIL